VTIDERRAFRPFLKGLQEPTRRRSEYADAVAKYNIYGGRAPLPWPHTCRIPALVARPIQNTACKWGVYEALGLMATAAEFDSLLALSGFVCTFYHQRGNGLLGRFLSVTPLVVTGHVGSAGSAVGASQNGTDTMTYDRHRQPDAERRFGSSRFRVGDALDAAFVHSLTALPGAVQHSTSPECKAYSRANFRRGTTKTPPLFQAQDAINEYNYRATGVPYLTETVRGAQGFTDPTRTTIIRGVDFGVFSTDAHLIQTPAGYLLRTDECLTSPGSVLLRRSCTGRNTAFSKVDCFFGLPLKRPCCRP